MKEVIGTYSIYYLSPPIYARHLRIHPVTFDSFGIDVENNTKFEILGCKVAKDSKSISGGTLVISQEMFLDVSKKTRGEELT